MFNDEINRLIRSKFANDIMESLQDCDVREFTSPLNHIKVPIRADAKIIYDAKLGDFSMEAFVHDIDTKKCIMARQVFSTREFLSTREKADMVEYLFKRLKRQFMHTLAQGELEKVLGVKVR